MPSVLHVRPYDGELEGLLVLEGLGVLPRHFTAPLLESRELPELPQAEGGLDIRHVVLEPGGDDLVAPAPALVVSLPGVVAHPVQAQDAGALQEIRLPSQHP